LGPSTVKHNRRRRTEHKRVMNKITVLISDDHPIVRDGLRLLLEAAGDIQVIGEAEDGQQAVLETKRLQPEVVLLDIDMPVLNGVEAARQITREVSSTRVLMLSMYGDSQHVQEALEAGATGYLSKETAANDLLRAIRKTRKGIAFFSRPRSKRLKRRRKVPLNGHSRKARVAPLSGRQTQTLQLIAEGYVTREIARLLRISRKTAEKHRQSLMDKLDIHEIASLTRYAVSCGIVPSNRAPNLQITAT
jgi:DNA-binding NarL/FixJ family response regulator